MSLTLQKQIKLPMIQSSVLRAATVAVQGTTEEIAKNARDRVPVDTGELKGSIIGQARGLQGEVNAEAPYALWVEVGTERQAAQPYLTPAVLDAADDLVAQILDGLR